MTLICHCMWTGEGTYFKNLKLLSIPSHFASLPIAHHAGCNYRKYILIMTSVLFWRKFNSNNKLLEIIFLLITPKHVGIVLFNS